MKVIFFILFFLVHAFSFCQDDAFKRYVKIIEYVRIEQCDEAENLMTEALSEQDEFFHIIQNYKARCFYDKGEPFHKIDSVLKIALEIKRSNRFYDECNGYSHWLYSMHYFKQKNHAKDEEHTKAGLKHFDKNSREYGSLLSNLGYIQLQLEKFDSAIDTFTKSLKHDPQNAYGYNNRALAYINLGQFKEAEIDLTIARDLDASNPYLYKHYALMYIAQKRNDKACDMLDKAKELGYFSFGGYDNNEVNDLLNKHCK